MKNKRRTRFILADFLISVIFLTILLPPVEARGDELTIAAAADLTFAFKDLTARFEQQTGDQVKVSYGSSGNFFSQIENGAPYDLFFSADVQYPEKLQAAGLIEPGAISDYAQGKLVIWVPLSSKLDLSKDIALLLDPEIHKIAIANPDHAPYGRAAVAAMRREGIYDQISSKLVMGENILQAAQFVQSGNADVGMVALSVVVAPAMKDAGHYVLVPPADYPPIIQAVAIIKTSRHKELARRFLAFMKEPATVTTLESFGFTNPGTK